MSTKIKRVCAGYYTADVPTTIDGKESTRRVEIVKVEGESAWYWTMDQGNGTDTEAGDWYDTKKDAVASMRACMAGGWVHVPGLGLCLTGD